MFSKVKSSGNNTGGETDSYQRPRRGEGISSFTHAAQGKPLEVVLRSDDLRVGDGRSRWRCRQCRRWRYQAVAKWKPVEIVRVGNPEWKSGEIVGASIGGGAMIRLLLLCMQDGEEEDDGN